jgi:hypothetical protein
MVRSFMICVELVSRHSAERGSVESAQQELLCCRAMQVRNYCERKNANKRRFEFRKDRVHAKWARAGFQSVPVTD